MPDLTFALHAGLSYKGFDFDMLFQGASGRSVSITGNHYFAFQNDGKVGPIALGRWTEGNKETATYPRLSSENNQNNYGVFSSYWQRDGSYIKLRSIELGYELPKYFLKKIGLLNTRIFLNGTNIFSLNRLEYSDAEIMSGYPAFRAISIGCSIMF